MLLSFSRVTYYKNKFSPDPKSDTPYNGLFYYFLTSLLLLFLRLPFSLPITISNLHLYRDAVAEQDASGKSNRDLLHKHRHNRFVSDGFEDGESEGIKHFKSFEEEGSEQDERGGEPPDVSKDVKEKIDDGVESDKERWLGEGEGLA